MTWTCRKCGATGGPGNRVQYHDCPGVPPEVDDSLDAAWAEAEEALPEGWIICRLIGIHPMPYGEPWQAQAEPSPAYKSVLGPYGRLDGTMWLGTGASGPTPAAALRALAAKLREVGR